MKTPAQQAQWEAYRAKGQTPEAKKKRGASVQRAMTPEGRARIIAAAQTPEAKAKRSASLCRPLDDRFLRYASPEPNSGCWLWVGSCDVRNYGQMRVDGKLRFATHISLELDGRPRPFPDACAMHKCDNPNCVNPDHLRWGTRKENQRDMAAKGRWGNQTSAPIRQNQNGQNIVGSDALPSTPMKGPSNV